MTESIVLENMNREKWLSEAVARLRPLLVSVDLLLPECVKVSCGFPGGGSRKTRIGECWVEDCQIFISPLKSEANGPEGVLSILLHELIHACLPVEYKHNKEFQRAMTAVGLEGKSKSSVAGEGLVNGLFQQIIKEIGPYPHIALEFKEVVKKSATRLLKLECPNCKLSVRITKKWVDAVVLEQKTTTCWLCGSVMELEKTEEETDENRPA